MPGPVSDSYDPEFGTGANVAQISAAAAAVRAKVTKAIGSEDLRSIQDVVREPDGPRIMVPLSERELRIIRFMIDRGLYSL